MKKLVFFAVTAILSVVSLFSCLGNSAIAGCRKETLFVDSDKCALFFLTTKTEFDKYKALYESETRLFPPSEFMEDDYVSNYLNSKDAFSNKSIKLIEVDSIYSAVKFKDGTTVDLLDKKVNLLKILFYKQGKIPVQATPTSIETVQNNYYGDNNFNHAIEDGCYLLTDFGWACYTGDLAKLKSINTGLFDINSDVMCDMKFSYGALYCSIMYEKIDVIKYLIENNIDVNLTHSELELAPLAMVALNGNENTRLKMAELLIKAGANVNGSAESSFYPLVNAINSGDVALVELLIKNGADTVIKGEPEDFVSSCIDELSSYMPDEAKKIREIIK